MGKMIKKSLALLLILVMTVSLAGCKKEAGEETPTGNVYVPTFSEIDCDIQWINQIFSNGDVITFMGEDYDNETYESTRIKIDYNLVTGEQTKTELESEGNEYYTAIQPMETGYYAVVESYVEPTQEELDLGIYDYTANFSFVEMDLEFNVVNEISLDEPLNVDNDGNELLLSDVIAMEEDRALDNAIKEEKHKIMYECINKLKAREKEIIIMRYGLYNTPEYTQKEVADKLGISQSYISRLEKRIMDKLKLDIEQKLAIKSS